MKSTTSLLLGAALATACFLLYTSVGDLAERSSPGSRPPRWSREEAHAKTASAEHAMEAVEEASFEPEVEERRIARGDGESKVGDGPGELREQIVMPAGREEPSQDIAELLKRAATDDKTVLMTAINDAWAAPNSFLDLFLESFRQGEQIEHLVKHLLIVAMDRKAFERCKAVHTFCYFFRVEGLDFASEQSYMKGDYLEMMWRRNRFQQTILELGYTFLFTDVDILWFRNPFPHLSPAAQLVMSSDFFVGDPNSMGNYPNGGLLYVRSCRSTIEFYKHWQASRAQFPGKHEQYVFDKIVKAGLPPHLGTRIQFLDTDLFGGFCQHGKDMGRVCTMHANCCVGLQNKLFDLRNVLQDWKEYRARVAAGNAEHFSWRVPGRCIH